MTGTHKWNTGIVARGRIYFAASNKVYGLPLREGPPPNRKGNTTNARIETADGGLRTLKRHEQSGLYLRR